MHATCGNCHVSTDATGTKWVRLCSDCKRANGRDPSRYVSVRLGDTLPLADLEAISELFSPGGGDPCSPSGRNRQGPVGGFR